MDQQLEDDLMLIHWQLAYVAKALPRARRLEKLRAGFHSELYQCISLGTTNYDPLNPREFSTATDTQAIRIIEAKERYDRLVQQEYGRHVRWGALLEWAEDKDKIILIRYFQKKKYVSPEIISELLNRLKIRVMEEEIRIEKFREGKAMKEFRSYLDAAGRKANEKKKNNHIVEKMMSIGNNEKETMTASN